MKGIAQTIDLLYFFLFYIKEDINWVKILRKHPKEYQNEVFSK